MHSIGMQELGFLAQDVTLPLYALLIAVILPVGYFARLAKETIENARGNETSTD